MPNYTLLVQGVTITGDCDLPMDELFEKDFFLLKDAKMGDMYFTRMRVRVEEVGAVAEQGTSDSSHLAKLQEQFNQPSTKATPSGRY